MVRGTDPQVRTNMSWIRNTGISHETNTYHTNNTEHWHYEKYILKKVFTCQDCSNKPKSSELSLGLPARSNSKFFGFYHS
jgi:hypothetical protein